MALKGAQHPNNAKALAAYRSGALREYARTMGRDEFKDNHARRCKGFRKRHNRQCKKYALKGDIYCKICGRLARYNREKGRIKKTGNDMRLRFYTNRLGPKLKERISELLEAPESDQLTLFDELALMRDVAGQALQLYSACDLLPEGAKKNEMALSAAMVMQGALEQVRIMAKTAAEISAMGKDKYSIHTLQDVVSQITKMVYLCFNDNAAGLNRFDAMLSEQLRLPKVGADGTTLTPDADVIAMDEMIPSKPEVLALEHIDLGDAPTTCNKCGAYDWGQTGNEPCDVCGLATQLDEESKTYLTQFG